MKFENFEYLSISEQLRIIDYYTGRKEKEIIENHSILKTMNEHFENTNRKYKWRGDLILETFWFMERHGIENIKDFDKISGLLTLYKLQVF